MNTIFIVFNLTRTGIEPEYTVSVAEEVRQNYIIIIIKAKPILNIFVQMHIDYAQLLLFITNVYLKIPSVLFPPNRRTSSDNVVNIQGKRRSGNLNKCSTQIESNSTYNI